MMRADPEIGGAASAKENRRISVAGPKMSGLNTKAGLDGRGSLPQHSRPSPSTQSVGSPQPTSSHHHMNPPSRADPSIDKADVAAASSTSPPHPRPSVSTAESNSKPESTPGCSTNGEVRAAKRRKVATACDECRQRKSRCDGVKPSCGPCTRKGRGPGRCTYQNDLTRPTVSQRCGAAAAPRLRPRSGVELCLVVVAISTSWRPAYARLKVTSTRLRKLRPYIPRLADRALRICAEAYVCASRLRQIPSGQWHWVIQRPSMGPCSPTTLK